MQHPNHEEWMDYLYGELNPVRHQTMRLHLDECSECSRLVGNWNSAMDRLDAMPTVVSTPRGSWNTRLVSGLAAAVVLVLGLETALSWHQRNSFKKQMAEMRQQLRKEFAAEVDAAFVQAEELAENQRVVDARQFAVAFAQAQQRMERRIALLRKDVETVAVNTEAGFEQNAQTWNDLLTAANSSRSITP